MTMPMVVRCPREDCRQIVYISVEGVPYDDAEVEHKLSRHWDVEHYTKEQQVAHEEQLAQELEYYFERPVTADEVQAWRDHLTENPGADMAEYAEAVMAL